MKVNGVICFLSVMFFVFTLNQKTQAEESNYVTRIINSSFYQNKDLTWDFDTKKLIPYRNKLGDDDERILHEYLNSDDLKFSSAARYLLSLQGNSQNDFFIKEYFNSEDEDIGNYYININFLSSESKARFMDKVDVYFNKTSLEVIEKFSSCKNYTLLNPKGLFKYKINSEAEFYSLLPEIKTKTYFNLLNLELDVISGEYPLTIYIYQHFYKISNNISSVCESFNTDDNILELKKTFEIYKGYKFQERKAMFCDTFKSNNFIYNQFLPYCFLVE